MYPLICVVFLSASLGRGRSWESKAVLNLFTYSYGEEFHLAISVVWKRTGSVVAA